MRRADHERVTPRFIDRRDAGRKLAAALDGCVGRPDVVVLALPRGGVEVGYEVARHLHAPLDVLVVRKLGFPDRPELAMGAVASNGVLVLNTDLVSAYGIPEEVISQVAARELQEIARREREYRGVRPALDLRGMVVIVVDDGLATGATMRAAAEAARAQSPARLVVAVPVGAPDSCDAMRAVGDDVVCLARVEPLGAVGLWYVDFEQTSDEEVTALLAMASAPAEERGVHRGA